MMYLNLLCRLDLELDSSAAGLLDPLRRKFGLLEASEVKHQDPRSSIRLEQRHKIPVIGDVHLGPRYSYGDGGLFIRDTRGATMRIGSDILSRQVETEFEYGFAQRELLSILEDVVFCKLIQLNALPVHSSAMRFRGKGFLFPAWGGTGKTSILLQALSKKDTLVSDEWNFVMEGEVYPYCDEILLMYYDLLAFPEFATKIDLLRARLFQKARPILVSLLLERLRISLRCKKVRISQLGSASASVFPLDHVCLLQRADVQTGRVDERSTGTIADFVTADFFRERSSLFLLLNLNSISNPSRVNPVTCMIEKYAALAKANFRSNCRRILIPKDEYVDVTELLYDGRLL